MLCLLESSDNQSLGYRRYSRGPLLFYEYYFFLEISAPCYRQKLMVLGHLPLGLLTHHQLRNLVLKYRFDSREECSCSAVPVRLIRSVPIWQYLPVNPGDGLKIQAKAQYHQSLPRRPSLAEIPVSLGLG